MGSTLGFQNKKAFQIDPESLPDHFPTLTGGTNYACGGEGGRQTGGGGRGEGGG